MSLISVSQFWGALHSVPNFHLQQIGDTLKCSQSPISPDFQSPISQNAQRPLFLGETIGFFLQKNGPSILINDHEDSTLVTHSFLDISFSDRTPADCTSVTSRHSKTLVLRLISSFSKLVSTHDRDHRDRDKRQIR